DSPRWPWLRPGVETPRAPPEGTGVQVSGLRRPHLARPTVAADPYPTTTAAAFLALVARSTGASAPHLWVTVGMGSLPVSARR
ncbi:MAG TPA: hypothetical protein VHT50_28910, partial [Mycobacterium sp.]|nr:hypothetical protein [Mycobacterium sp.]